MKIRHQIQIPHTRFRLIIWKIGISSVGTTIDEKNLIRNFENPTPDSDSPYPISFDQTLWKIGISSVGTTIDEKNLIRNFENPTSDLDSPYPITQGPTNFQSFMTNDSHLLI